MANVEVRVHWTKWNQHLLELIKILIIILAIVSWTITPIFISDD